MTHATQIAEILKANNVNNYIVKDGKRAVKWFARYENQNAGYQVGISDALWQIRLASVVAYNEIASLIGYTKYNF
jgi:hypothetical protein